MPNEPDEITVTDWAQRARACGPLRPGWFRTLVVEGDLGTSFRDFVDRAAALAHADDAASEGDGMGPLAFVFDGAFELVDRGVHYAVRARAGRSPQR